ncbi:hypothetical protein [Mucilaginibacter paludis]|uniref:hypothetical protein n=1 Tax=Mucilaginibacter paludis TaxID=423351 RepID=UPI0001E9DC87|nr:hypothetical protein [Mucilaginibacter paludis]
MNYSVHLQRHHSVRVPVLFSRKYFAELLSLQGHESAKKLLARYTLMIRAY